MELTQLHKVKMTSCVKAANAVVVLKLSGSGSDEFTPRVHPVLDHPESPSLPGLYMALAVFFLISQINFGILVIDPCPKN